MEQLPLFLFFAYALFAGLAHAFEADHVLAVSNIVSQRDKIWPAVKDGIYWGLGHTSTIFIVGMIILLLKVNIPDSMFSYFEATVGLMLMAVATYRIVIFWNEERPLLHKHGSEHAGENGHLHLHIHARGKRLHKASYGIGLVHGLAGSGALVVLVMSQIKSMNTSLLYLLVFGLGSVAGMVLVTGVFSVPFSKKVNSSNTFKAILILVSSGLCLAYGGYSIYKNLLT